MFGPWERPGSRARHAEPSVSDPGRIRARRAGGHAGAGPAETGSYAPDAAEAVAILVEAGRPRHRLYNISNGGVWPAHCNGAKPLQRCSPGLECRLAAPGETTVIKLHGPARAPLSVARMAEEFGWRARFGCAESAAAMSKLADPAQGMDLICGFRGARPSSRARLRGLAAPVQSCLQRKARVLALVDRDAAGPAETLSLSCCRR